MSGVSGLLQLNIEYNKSSPFEQASVDRIIETIRAQCKNTVVTYKFLDSPIVINYGSALQSVEPLYVLQNNESTCCEMLKSIFKSIGVVVAIFAGLALMGSGVALGLAAAEISILGSAAYAAPVLKVLGTTWSYVAAAGLAILGVSIFVGVSSSICNSPNHVRPLRHS